ncbi:hypothetical protein D9Q98_009490 [Chlorella vulgaris]|uniref:Uncharacterized protein n=1 Tax=Chlorella vulgaris TaxID=3077 RepID=A0A9D4TFA2_CHLVU|nr:hypothetical protein D9Q98_009490 [Chlorella vulgaris]
MATTSDWDIASKRVVITGSTSGIGRETAAQLAAQGAHVVLACRNLPLAEQVAADIRRQHLGATVEVGPQLDLASLESIRQFAAAYKRSGQPLHVLINNAGTNYQRPWQTPEGVGGLCQVNYLGPYALTRLLEDTLQQSAPARVVNLSSVTHRFGWLGDVARFLPSWVPGSYYPSTKLANVLFANEMQRRLGEHGVQSCAVDPGGVASKIWDHSAFAKPPLSWVINNLYAPTSDGAAAVVHAATVPWGRERLAAAAINQRWSQPPGSRSRRNAARPLPDLRFYARGLFTSPLVTSWRGIPQRGFRSRVRQTVWGLSTLAHSLLDWPLRRLSGGRILAQTRCVPSAPLSYDSTLAAQLWDLSADAAQLPRDCKLVGKAKR